MPTYDNPKTDVVHWVSEQGPGMTRTACHFLDPFRLSWDRANLDPVGEPVDVTCCKCRETAAFLDAVELAAEAQTEGAES